MSNNMPNRDQAEGKIDETLGTAQKNLGGLTGDADMQAQGAERETEGKAQGALGGLKNAVGNAADAVKDTFNNAKGDANRAAHE